MDVRVKLGDSRLKSDRIRLFANRVPFVPFCAGFNFIGRQPEAVSDVLPSCIVGLIVPDRWLKFCNPRVNLSGEIQAEAVGCGIFDSLFAVTPERKQQMSSYPVWLYSGAEMYGCRCEIW